MSYLYVEHCRIEKDNQSIKLVNADGEVPVPVAALCALLLGPGTTITHDAVRVASECGCTLLWTGEEGVRLYAYGTGETRKASRLLKQVAAWANVNNRLRVVVAMYTMRFADGLPAGLSLQQIRGKEGVRVRETYAACSRHYGVTWSGRQYDRQNWQNAEPINKALSTANSCLYGVTHAAIVSAGYSAALGFVHTGKQLSFVYDIADLYKTETTIPAAFAAVAANEANVERAVRITLREKFREAKLLGRIMADIDRLLDVTDGIDDEYADDPSLPAGYWDPPAETEKKILCL